MFNFNKQKEEIKKDIKEEIHGLMEDGKVVSIGIMVVGCLSVGYVLGSITTAAMYRTMLEINR